MKQLMIIGAGGHGRVIADIALSMGEYTQVSFLDDRFGDLDPGFPGVPLVGRISDADRYLLDCDFIVGIGDIKTRARIQGDLTAAGAHMATLIHPRAVIGRHVTVGRGTVIMAGAIVQTGAVLGDGCIVNTGASVDHGDNIGDFSHISVGAHLGGGVRIGAYTFVCLGACVINNITVCDDCILGAGSVTIRDITEPGTYVGVPAQRIN